ncbi:M56 family metallopeptidase [Gimesia aquarii]|uniref:Regulatory protein BlaR1 n=1 Tax=Gimesia aquarii TaxID=2527964 RepID=A0A517W0G4_9PLAN|nr:M56 family metallopeptidase [Gimesia aquarii]QDT98730.1 Regulatory protein BlaR1 [Gimesia aquarii]
MWQTLFETGISNALVASVMALLVLVITRIWKSPHVAHLLWLLVLVKLVSPPLWHVSIPVPHMSAHFPAKDATETLSLNESQINFSKPEPLKLEEVETMSGSLVTPVLNDSLSHLDDTELAEQGFELMARSQHVPLAVEASVLPHPEGRESLLPFLPDVPDETVLWWVIPGLVWMAGSLIWIIIFCCRVVEFNRLIRQTLPATDELKSVAGPIAKKLSLSRLPDLRLTEAVVSPLVWPAAYPPNVVLPKQLVDGMHGNQLATILAHEFAHLRRADHWVRFLEVVVVSLYWWNPIVLWVRRELRAAEEACCDALVLRMYPDQLADYGEALLRTNEFIMSDQVSSPVLASGFGHSCSLKRRVEMILKNEFGKPASPVVKIMILTLAFGVLPMAAEVALGQKEVVPSDLDINIEVEQDEELPVPGPKRVRVKVKPVNKGDELDDSILPSPETQVNRRKLIRSSKIKAQNEDREEELLLSDDSDEDGHRQARKSHSDSLEKRVDRMESLLKQLLAAQTRKNVRIQSKTQPPHITVFGTPELSHTASQRRNTSIKNTTPVSGIAIGLPGPTQLHSPKSHSRSGKEIKGLGDPAVIEKIVQHLQYEKSGRDLIMKKQAEIERLTKEVAQLKAAFEQIEQLKAALKRAEEAKAKARY